MKHSMRKATRQTVMTASALALSLLLAACGGGSATPPAGSTNSTAPDTTPPTVSVTDNVPGVATGDVTFTVTASEPLLASSFTISDLIVKGGTVGALTFVSPTVATLVVTPTPNSAGTITIDLPAGSITDLAGNATTVAATQATQDFNTIPTTFGNTGTCKTTATVNCLTNDETTLAFTPFGDINVAVVANDPVNSANKVLKITKPAPSQTWAGVTIHTTESNKSVAIVGLSTNKVVTLRVYAPAAGLPILLKVENAANDTQFVEKSVNTTKANAWETITFDFATPTGGTYDEKVTYNKVSVFPNFGTVETSNKDYYFDELTYAVGAAPVVVPPPSSSKLTYASNYSVNKSEQGGDTGRYADDANVSSPWDGIAAVTDTIRSFYFGYHMNAASKAWGFGGYVKAPNNGTASISAYSSATLTLWGNSELFNTKPNLTVLLIGPTTSGCTPKLIGTIAASSIDPTAYTVAKSGLTVDVACPSFNTVDTIWNGGVNEVHIQVLESNKAVQYVTSTAAGYPNGLNIGPITFQ